MMKVITAIDKPYVMPIEVAQLKSESAGGSNNNKANKKYVPSDSIEIEKFLK